MIRAVVVLSLIFMILPFSPARADLITLCTDQEFDHCSGSVPVGFTQFYVIHSFTIGTTGSRFKPDISLIPGAAVLGFDSPFTHSGDADQGWSLTYDECKEGRFIVGTLFVMVTCGELRLDPVVPVNCSGQDGYALSNTFCVCIPGFPSECYPTATEPMTWGSVKALYR